MSQRERKVNEKQERRNVTTFGKLVLRLSFSPRIITKHINVSRDENGNGSISAAINYRDTLTNLIPPLLR